MRIGLYGGSFNPAHQGHRLVADQALKKLKLDALWWLVTPGNPLKSHTDLAPLETRIANARALADNPKIHVTGFEAAHGFTYTYQTLKFLRYSLPSVKFAWIMGADSLASFHHWEQWESIFSLMPIAVYDRPHTKTLALNSKAAIRFGQWRIAEREASTLITRKPPSWVFLHGQTSPQSSTSLRAKAQGHNCTTN